jgi:putative ABC transport system permease protein
MALPLYYNWRNLLARKLSTGLTFVVVAVVVLVLSLLLSFAAGIRASLVASGHPDNLIVLAPGATSESTSMITPAGIARLVQTPGLAHDPANPDALLLSPELCVQASIPRRSNGGNPANVAVRGVDDVAWTVHPEVRLIEGRHFAQGALEAIVGKSARERFAGLDIGSQILIGRKAHRQYKVVGIFAAGGGALESEIWAPRTMLADSYQRHMASSVFLRLDDLNAAKPAIAYINGATVQLEAKTETQYYVDVASKTREIVLLTTALVAIMAIGAAFAVANTMYAAVDGRRRELAMLRALGFGRPSIMVALLSESLLLCLGACVCGLAASMLFSGSRQDYLSDTTWTVLAYELRITPGIIVTALLLATVVGALGTWFPAQRAARLNVLEALRKA